MKENTIQMNTSAT